MPRAKSYDRDEALTKARDAFWRNGYAGTGVRALGEETGINRFALQTEFNGKLGLFLEVLDRYSHDAVGEIVTPIAGGGLKGIRQFFDRLMSFPAGDPHTMGCLVMNTAIENAGISEPEVKSRTQAYYDTLIAAFSSALLHEQDAGRLAKGVDVGSAAEMLLSLTLGLQAVTRFAGSSRAVRGQRAAIYRVLDSLSA